MDGGDLIPGLLDSPGIVLQHPLHRSSSTVSMDGMSSPSLNSGCLQSIHREQDLQLAGLDALEGGLAIGGGGGGPSLRPVTPVALDTWRQYI